MSKLSLILSIFIISVCILSTEAQEDIRILDIPEITAAPGDTITISTNIDNAVGIAGADIIVTYDPDVLVFSEVQQTALSDEMWMQNNPNTAGKVIIAMANASGIEGASGSLVNIVFTVNSSVLVGAESAIEFESAGIYDVNGEEIPLETRNGNVLVCIKGDVNGNGDVNSGDAVLALRIAVDLIQDLEAWQICAADMNGDGDVTAIDGSMILQESVGLAAPGKGVPAYAGEGITVALAEMRGVVGENINVPINIDKSYAVAGGDICVSYKSDVLRAVQVTSDMEILLASNVDEPGKVRIAFTGACVLGDEALAEIQFEVLADDTSPLRIQEIALHDPELLSLNTECIDREFRSWAMPAENNALLQNFPNPFNPETWIPYQLKEASEVAVRIYSSSGELVRNFELGHKSIGFYTDRDRALYWDGKNEVGESVSSGVYFYNIRTDGFSATRKMIVAK